MGYLVDWIRLAENTSICLGDLDDSTLRTRLYPPVSACIFTTNVEKAKREIFIAHLNALTRQELLRINYEKEKREKAFYHQCGVNI